jgi:FdrA protein
LEALQEDPATELVVLVSKPPAPAVAARVLEQVSARSKPTVVCFLGNRTGKAGGNPAICFAQTLEGAALQAATFVKTGAWAAQMAEAPSAQGLEKARLRAAGRFLRGLFSGGTLCYEAQVIWRDRLPEPVLSNAPLDEIHRLPDSLHSQGHCAVDLGEEEFTVGRPHPMIDNDLRIRRLLQEAHDPQTAVILLDVVLGYGAHPDPAGELGPAIRQAKEIARQAGRELPVIASVTGTEQDPQCLSRQAAALEAAGVLVCPSNAEAARISASAIGHQGFDPRFPR